MLYLNGNGVPADLAAAANWIEKAAHNDHAASQFQLGVMYCTGQGVPQDLPQAIAWYELAAQLGHPLAQYNLAVMLAKGQGCEPDRTRRFHGSKGGRARSTGGTTSTQQTREFSRSLNSWVLRNSIGDREKQFLI